MKVYFASALRAAVLVGGVTPSQAAQPSQAPSFMEGGLIHQAQYRDPDFRGRGDYRGRGEFRGRPDYRGEGEFRNRRRCFMEPRRVQV